jgi:hypothetical protein
MATQQEMDLQDFIDKLVREKREYEGLEPEVITEIKLELLERLEDRINAVVVNNIPEDQTEEFEKITESGTDEEVQAFTQKAIPDLAHLIATELIVFKQTYLG